MATSKKGVFVDSVFFEQVADVGDLQTVSYFKRPKAQLLKNGWQQLIAVTIKQFLQLGAIAFLLAFVTLEIPYALLVATLAILVAFFS